LSAQRPPEIDDESAGANDWAAIALGKLQRGPKLLLATFVAAALRPRRFAADWALGKRATNPLSFAAAILAASTGLSSLIGPGDAEMVRGPWASLARELVRPALYYGSLLMLAVVAQVSVRKEKGRRPFTATVGACIYALGPSFVGETLGYSLAFLLGRQGAGSDLGGATNWMPLEAMVLGGIGYYAGLLPLLAGLHGIRLWRITKPFLVLFLVAFGGGVVFGFFSARLERIGGPHAKGWTHQLMQQFFPDKR
jgi:hypothetical protein